MARLVALDLPGGSEFVDELRRVWDAGDALLPVDQRLPQQAKRDLLHRLGAGAVIGAGRDEQALPGGRPVEDGDALVVATSGSTGEPKGVVLTHAAVAASAEATSQRLDVGRDDHWLACLPLSHVGGLSVVTRAIHTGTRLTVLPQFDAGAVAATEATLVSLVPTVLARIDPSRFRKIVLGGARAPADLPVNVVTTYGLTETGSGVVYDGVPLDGVELWIDGGEIMLRCPMALRCYRDGIDPRDPGGWLATGDLGEIDTSGRLVVHGRRDDLIVTGGENVWPEPVEAALRTVPGVADVAVAGTPDDEWGQVVTAYVVPRAGGEPVTLDAVRAAVKAVLPAFAAPRRVLIVDRLPRTALGKVQRVALPTSLPAVSTASRYRRDTR